MSNTFSKKDKLLEVKNLRISFRTLNGTVKAVRGVDFALYRGRTLAIVGESGSGKSVTSRAIMGILAPNKIVEEGEILYDGKDLLRISEEDYCKIRGSRISMIFQDPMSSLNPIMKVGKQITESMVLKSKANKKDAKKTVARLEGRLVSYCEKDGKDATIKEKLKALDKAIEEGKEYSVDNLKDDVNGLLLSNYGERRTNCGNALELLKTIKESGHVRDKELDTKYLESQLKELSAKIPVCENRLHKQRDEIISTFIVSYRHIINVYKKTLKREDLEAKEAAKKANKKAKGKNADDSVKKRAFSSEIDTSHGAIAAKMTVLIDEISERLNHLKDKDIKQDDKKVIDFLNYLTDNIKELHVKHNHQEYVDRALKVMGEVGIPEPEKRINQYPFQFSGGMRQRIVIAIALSSNPEILICDEPTTALDVTIQAQILELINKLKVERNLSIIFITHNLGVVANMADDIAVMYAGKIVEYGKVEEIFYEPKHPYTWALLASMPDLETKEKLDAIPGTPPNMIIPPKGDAFAYRNKYALKIDFEYEPPLFKVSDTHYAATWLLYPNAPVVNPPKLVSDRITRMKKLHEETLQKEAQEGKEAQ